MTEIISKYFVEYRVESGINQSILGERNKNAFQWKLKHPIKPFPFAL